MENALNGANRPDAHGVIVERTRITDGTGLEVQIIKEGRAIGEVRSERRAREWKGTKKKVCSHGLELSGIIGGCHSLR